MSIEKQYTNSVAAVLLLQCYDIVMKENVKDNCENNWQLIQQKLNRSSAVFMAKSHRGIQQQ